MKLKVCIDFETKDLPFKDIIEELDFDENIEEKDFDSRADEIAENISKQIMEGDKCPLGKIKISLVRMGR